MAAPNVHVELVNDPHRHRAVIGWSASPRLLRVAAEELILDAERRAEQFAGLDDLIAEQERAEVERLRRVLDLVLPDGRAS